MKILKKYLMNNIINYYQNQISGNIKKKKEIIYRLL